ncbi:hypothetical protein NXZ75_13675 [Lysinibacillus sphaericus]|uniref:hypothetical protein n=1 Tax=Lysinibacillus sphaericus TaxID=1421 RepID=UPI002161D30B|nr:hypothetical protein [Lysinibacillus sphaericus]MCS1383251.1 hypothetical protein [Lysinibacillus sphaericus]
MKIIAILTFILITMNLILTIIKMIRLKREIDAAYQRGLSDARQASSEAINEIKIKISEGESFHESAADVANELSERLKERIDLI